MKDEGLEEGPVNSSKVYGAPRVWKSHIIYVLYLLIFFWFQSGIVSLCHFFGESFLFSFVLDGSKLTLRGLEVYFEGIGGGLKKKEMMMMMPTI